MFFAELINIVHSFVSKRKEKEPYEWVLGNLAYLSVSCSDDHKRGFISINFVEECGEAGAMFRCGEYQTRLEESIARWHPGEDVMPLEKRQELNMWVFQGQINNAN